MQAACPRRKHETGGQGQAHTMSSLKLEREECVTTQLTELVAQSHPYTANGQQHGRAAGTG